MRIRVRHVCLEWETDYYVSSETGVKLKCFFSIGDSDNPLFWTKQPCHDAPDGDSTGRNTVFL